MEPLKQDFAYYQKNSNDIISKYQGKWVVIKNCEILGAYESLVEAINETTKKHELGTFLVQLAKDGADKATFRSRVAG
jgi:hypothetical protein